MDCWFKFKQKIGSNLHIWIDEKVQYGFANHGKQIFVFFSILFFTILRTAG